MPMTDVETEQERQDAGEHGAAAAAMRNHYWQKDLHRRDYRNRDVAYAEGCHTAGITVTL